MKTSITFGKLVPKSSHAISDLPILLFSSPILTQRREDVGYESMVSDSKITYPGTYRNQQKTTRDP